MIEVNAYTSLFFSIGTIFWATGYLIIDHYGVESKRNLKIVKWFGLLGYLSVFSAGVAKLIFTYFT